MIAPTRAVAARSLVVRTLALHLHDLHVRLAELEAAIAAVVRDDDDAQRLQAIPGIGPQNAATIRAELGDVSRFSRVEQIRPLSIIGTESVNTAHFPGLKASDRNG